MAEQHLPVINNEFIEAVNAIRAVEFRRDITVTEITAPSQLAPSSIALGADVNVPVDEDHSLSGVGRFVLLYDPESPESWGGPWRIVLFAQSALETDIASDPFVSDVTWAWLVDALESHQAPHHSASGTATKIISQGFGELEAEGQGAQLELRASWSPTDCFDAHVEAWAEIVCMLAGLPPESDNVTLMPTPQ